jgi:hypothetical protein
VTPAGLRELPHREGRETQHASPPSPQNCIARTGSPNRHTESLHTASAERNRSFSHNWLDNGGAEGDLMELNGWSSPQMLARYGRSARSARARRHYDDVMGD